MRTPTQSAQHRLDEARKRGESLEECIRMNREHLEYLKGFGGALVERQRQIVAALEAMRR